MAARTLRHAGWSRTAVLALSSLAIAAPTALGQVTLVPTSEFGGDLSLITPAVLGLLATLFLAWFILPKSLSSLQVAFEADEGLFEVHRLTKTRSDARELLWRKGVPLGVLAYLMAMTALSVLIFDLLIGPNRFYWPVAMLIAICVIVPVLLSPWETLIAQLDQFSSRSKRGAFVRFMRRIWAFIMVAGGTAAVLMFGLRRHGEVNATWMTIALLVFMAPTIFAYGRIVGASWNMLLLSKWRTVGGKKTAINPDKPSFVGRLSALILVLFLASMPFTAVNAVFTVLYVTFGDVSRTASLDILNFGGVAGWFVVDSSQMRALIEQWQWVKAVPQILAMFLTMNIAIIGLAFIFELIRNLFLGGQSFGGAGGVTLAATREVRAEGDVQGRLLYFAFAGFSGYTVLLVILTCYKEFGSLMPFTSELGGLGFEEFEVLRATWTFIAAGQAIFLLVWLMGIWRFLPLRKYTFDLSPDERREGAFRTGSADWMKTLIDEAARNDELDKLVTFQADSIKGDQSLVRLAKSRAKMYEMALRGLWPKAISEARNVLAQQGGEDDEARLLIAAGHLACRRIDAARESLSALEEEDDHTEPEVIAFIADYMNPWHGKVTDDDLWEFQDEPMIDNLMDMMQRFRQWSPDSEKPLADRSDDLLVAFNHLMQVATLRAQREHDKALDLAMLITRSHPQLTKARIALALCLLDQNEWHLALDIYESLAESAAADPRVDALGEILGVSCRSDELEVLLSKSDWASKQRRAELRPYLRAAPTSPTIGLHFKRDANVSLTANAMVVADQSVKRAIDPIYSLSAFSRFVQLFILWPSFIAAGWWASENLTDSPAAEILGGMFWPSVTLSLFIMQFGMIRLRRSQRREIRQIDQKAMVAYARRLRRSRVDLDISKVPVGNHMLFCGILVTINKTVYDLGFPGWLCVRLERKRGTRAHLRSRSREMRKRKPPRYTNLKPLWWKNQPRSLSKEGTELKKRVKLVMQDFHSKGGRSGQQRKRLRPQSRIQSALGLEVGGSLISMESQGEHIAREPKRQPKGAPPMKEEDAPGTADFSLSEFLDEKRRT